MVLLNTHILYIGMTLDLSQTSAITNITFLYADEWIMTILHMIISRFY